MTASELIDLIPEFADQIKDLISTKGRDYAKEINPFSHFDEMANRLDIDRKIVWAIFANKHWAAIETYCSTGKLLSEGIKGRILDAATYLFLLYGMIIDEAPAENEKE